MDGLREVSARANTPTPFAFDTDGEACDAPRARCDETDVGWNAGREIARRIGGCASNCAADDPPARGGRAVLPLPKDVMDAALEARLFAGAGTKQGHRRRAETDWAAVHRELKCKH